MVWPGRRRASSCSIRSTADGAQLDFGHQVSRLLRVEGEDVVDLAVDGKIPAGAAGYLAGVAGPGAASSDPESARNVVVAFEAFLTEDTTMAEAREHGRRRRRWTNTPAARPTPTWTPPSTPRRPSSRGPSTRRPGPLKMPPALLDELNLLAAAGILLLALLGLFQRLREYRA